MSIWHYDISEDVKQNTEMILGFVRNAAQRAYLIFSISLNGSEPSEFSLSTGIRLTIAGVAVLPRLELKDIFRQFKMGG